jgi:hypothetical protein
MEDAFNSIVNVYLREFIVLPTQFLSFCNETRPNTTHIVKHPHFYKLNQHALSLFHPTL